VERSSEVILRNQSKLPPGGILLLNPPRDNLYSRLTAAGHPVKCFTQHHGDFRWLEASGADVQFGVVPAAEQISAVTILHLPREKDLLAMLSHALASAMPAQSCLWLVGDNKAGIKSAPRHLEPFYGQVVKLDSARHCGLYEARQPRPGKPWVLSDYLSRWAAHYAGKDVKVLSLPGVFAHGRLDPGSRLLLKVLEGLEPSGKILDFACGSGVVACALLAADSHAELTLLDVSSLALESSRQTLILNQQQAMLLPSDGLSEVDARFDWIISNPPFHRGIHNDLDIAADFFTRAGTFLTGKGRIVIVCNRHLPYKKWLQDHFKQVEELAVDEQFRVIMAASAQNR
jgi:16S rRNA (guanine1207-N2)-methyltransferase